MTSAARLFVRLVLRPQLKEPLRSALTVLAVALGVGVVVAIDLAGQAAAGSFHSSLESLTGKSDLLIRGTGGIDERLLGKLVQLPYAFQFSPRIEDFASLGGRGEAVPFIGLDLIANGQDFSRGNNEELPIDEGIWVGTRMHRKAGDRIRLLINDRLRNFTVAGVLPASQTGEESGANILLADIGLAQAVTGKRGKLDAIDVRVPPGKSIDYWQSLLRRALPASVSVDAQGARTEENRKMLSAFRWNLHVLSYIAIVVGGFLIYNTISISVVRRRTEIGIVRALGGSRGLILLAFLAEAVAFALAGSLLGIVVGRIMAIGAVGLIGSTVQSLYVSSQPGAIRFTAASLLTGIALGVGLSLLAAIAPALEASLVPPVEAMARGREQYRAAIRSRATGVYASILLALSVVLSMLPAVDGRPLFGYFAVLLGIAGTALIIPNLVVLFARIATGAVQKLLGVEALIAMRSLTASIARTSVLTAALATAVAMTASVGIMVGSFRETVLLWMNNQLQADFYLRPAGSASADRYPVMNAEIADRIEQLPGVASVDRFRAYPITYEGLPATLAGGENSRVSEKASIRFLPGEDRGAILSKLATGAFAVVSEPFANKHHIEPGSVISLPLAGATRHFTVLGIYYDYSAERGYIVLDRGTLLKYLPDKALSNIAVYLQPDANGDAVRAAIDRAISGRAVLVFSHGALRRAAIQVFDRTFRITYALEAVAVFVAVMGIAGALLAIVIDRRREFGLIRCLGAERAQVRKIILCEAGLLGLLANIVGLVLGTFLSLILIFVINKQSFGWTIQFHWPIALLFIALTGIYLATILAGFYPARTATRLKPIEVLHEG